VTKENASDLKEQWEQDDEPESCIIDSWAQGYVQSVVIDNKDNKFVDFYKFK
jgi:hypothetical protein